MSTIHVFKYLGCALALIVLLSTSASAQAPAIISFQGILADANGVPLPDGNHQITLYLYNSATGGTAIWTDARHTVQVVRGVFSTMLGGPDKQPLPDFSQPYWLGIRIGTGTELSPRTQLASVPYALNSVRADSAAHVIGGIPAGTVMAFAGSAARVPSGWMICNGTALRSAEYPQLFGAISTSWGDGTEDADARSDFNLPDLRGMFLRGVDDSSKVDVDASSRYARMQGGATGATVGTYQNDASVNSQGMFDQTISFDPPRLGNSSSNATGYATSGAAETRPKNAYVNYIIKVR